MSDVTLIRLDSRGFIICEFVAGASVLGSLKGQRRLIPQDKASTQGVTDTEIEILGIFTVILIEIGEDSGK